MSPTAESEFVSPRQVRRNFARAAAHYDANALLQAEIASRMLERLDYVRIEPEHIVDLGCGTGNALAALSARYPKSTLLGADLSEAMLGVARAKNLKPSLTQQLLRLLRLPGSAERKPLPQLLAADANLLPLKSASTGLLWSNLMLHWLDEPQAALREIHRVLAVGGLFMFSTFGPDTLKELRASFNDGGVHTQRFADLHDIGDMLVANGFADPVMDMEVLTLTYDSLDKLFSDLRQTGSGCAMQARRPGLMGRRTWQTMLERYAQSAQQEKDGKQQDGKQRFPASFEIVYGHAWKAERQKSEDGRAIIRFQPKPL
ncbi:MAG: malonyl-ACP O-methyltransferase BioC [Pseudomonadota bacterium]